MDVRCVGTYGDPLSWLQVSSYSTRMRWTHLFVGHSLVLYLPGSDHSLVPKGSCRKRFPLQSIVIYSMTKHGKREKERDGELAKTPLSWEGQLFLTGIPNDHPTPKILLWGVSASSINWPLSIHVLSFLSDIKPHYFSLHQVHATVSITFQVDNAEVNAALIPTLHRLYHW